MDQVTMLKVADVVPTSDNPRHIKPNDPRVEELAESIRATGLLCPVICRPHPKQAGKYELRAGFRRLLAHQALGAPEIMAIVREMDDKTAMEVTVLENLQREDLTPLEEGRGVAGLLDSGSAVEDIAAEIGKSAAWVYRRASLQRLIPELEKACEDPASMWAHATAGHLEVLARLPAERQKLIAGDKYFRMPRTAGDLAELLERDEHRLKAAAWDLDDMTLPGLTFACNGCTNRTDVQPELFGDDLDSKAIAKKARCLDPECWGRKSGAWLKRREAELRAVHGDRLAVVGGYELDGAKAPIRRTHDMWSVDRCKQNAPGARPALWVEDGTAKDCWVKVRPSRDGNEVKPKQPSITLRRKAWVIKHVEKALTAKDTECPLTSLTQAGALVALFGTNGSASWAGTEKGIWKKAAALECAGGKAIVEALWAQVRPVLCRRLRFNTVSTCGPQFEDAVNQAALLRLGDEAALMKSAEGAVKGVAEKKRK